MLTAEDIYQAHQRVIPHIIRTPLINSPAISRMTGTTVSLKLETLQISGSFKVRGALNAILSNSHKISRMKGVITASAGNHAQGLAVAARTVGVQAIIVMPEWSSLTKQEAVRAYGAEVIIFGRTIDESVERTKQLENEGWFFIHPFDDLSVMAGQGTIGLEILDELPDVDAILVPVGGGGLIAGISTIIKEHRPDCRIIGVQGGRCPSALQALKHGAPVCTPASWTLADGIRVTKTGSRTYPIIENLVDEIIQVEEDEIAQAILCLMERKRIVAEGAGASPLAALLSGRCSIKPGSSVVLLISGGNIDTQLLARVVRRALMLDGRIMQLTIDLWNQPGSLVELLQHIAEKGGNILHIHHQVGDPCIPMESARVVIELETRSSAHRDEICTNLRKNGYDMPDI